jgi:hypothetical protein
VALPGLNLAAHSRRRQPRRCLPPESGRRKGTAICEMFFFLEGICEGCWALVLGSDGNEAHVLVAHHVDVLRRKIHGSDEKSQRCQFVSRKKTRAWAGGHD